MPSLQNSPQLFPNRWTAVVGGAILYNTMPTDFPSKRSLSVDTLATKRILETTMRKTRLVILPTKCLHQMGFLLLFLSCPVIGDWGRIRPESEDSHNAIQIEREGTCGMERDPPGGLLKFLDEDGSKQCRLSNDQDANTPIKAITRSGERRVDVRRINTQRTSQISERRIMDERRGIQREVRRNMRSRSLDSRRIMNGRNDAHTRSLSLGRMETDRTQRTLTRNTRQYDAENSRKESERFHSTRRINERRNEQRERQRRLSIDTRRERERRERETVRLARSHERERQDMRRDSNRKSIQEQFRARENDKTRRLDERSEKRSSPVRRDGRTESRRSSDRVNLDRRVTEIRRARSLESLGRKSEERENLARLVRNDNRRETENFRRLVTATTKPSEQNIRERRSGLLMEREVKSKRESRSVSTIEGDYKKADDEGLFAGVTKRMDLKSYDGFNTGDWTTNCVIGAVVYFFTTRQIKSV